MKAVSQLRQVLKSTLSLQYKSSSVCQTRGVFWILYSAVNRIDTDRIKLIGPDKACAEWLVKCGASIRFHRNNKMITDYFKLGLTQGRDLRLAEVYAEEAMVMNDGFEHFKGVTQIEKLTFKRCARFDNSCIYKIVQHLSENLNYLEIVSCGDVNDKGLALLTDLQSLKTLKLFELPAVKHKKDMFHHLTAQLPDCSVTYVDHDGFHMSTESENPP